MGAGFHGGFGNTYGAAAGDAVFKSKPGQYFSNIAKRTDIDRNGFMMLLLTVVLQLSK